KIMLVLVGEKTKNLHKFVRWEQEVALSMNIPIVAVNLNGSKGRDNDLCPPIIRDQLVLHIPYKMATCRWAIDFWPEEYKTYKQNGKTGPYHLNTELLNKLLSE
ncbi:MAG: TIR domain-containing protein, partial [Bacteroidetes bacterium]|nr:TIR domain-containing protein [Bacteroidota bacterium]